MKYTLKSLLSLSILGCCLWTCSEKEVPGEPYGPSAESLGIVINRNQSASPATGLPGTEVTINASGLLPYREELVFRFNGELAEITEVTDQYIKIIVPDFASTGVTSVSVGDVVVFGPQFSVTGKINIDPSFNVTQGTNDGVEQIIQTNDGRMILVGAFTNYDNKGIVRPINRIARTFADGTYDASLRSGVASNGVLGNILYFNNGYLIGGAFNGFSQRGADISNLTHINENGTIDTMGVHPFRRPDQSDTIKYYPRFNGGFDAWVDNLYAQDGKVIVNGSFRYYISRRYDQPNRLETRDSIILDSIEVRQFARLNADGSLDKTYRFDAGTNRSWDAGNGEARTTLITGGPNQGKLMVYGSFTRFDGQQFGRVLRLNADGTIDQTFNPEGIGADQEIHKLFHSPSAQKYVVSGSFRNFNGQPANQMVMLNEDGSVDESFIAGAFEGGEPTFIKQLSDGKIIVAGNFRTYAGVARNGFMVLDEQGNLLPQYNATGIFSGRIEDVIETTSADGQRALLIYGYFFQFNSQPVNHIIRVLID
ncbi:IPT/TIG domain-containing protein [Parapedobacter sp. DT-150]|uniref:IPT/TIG domain-containing protein n=1 Tax=Parapedobacter sp. DT-150 TaxID=3396162 RepID=UPI003F19B0BC